MKNTRLFLYALMGILLFGSCKKTTKDSIDNSVLTKERIVSLNGALTEILFALDVGEYVVGRDVTSTYPKWIKDSIKDLGHVRSLNIESLAALKPTVILGTNSELNSDMKQAIQNLGIRHKFFEQDFSVDGTKSLISELAHFMDIAEPRVLLNKIDSDLEKIHSFQHPPKVLFIYARGAGTMMVAGEGTPMERIIELAKGQNAVQGFKDFKPLTEEALLGSNPDVILLFETGLQSVGGVDGLIKTTPGILQTKAGKNKAVIAMDGALLADFGPRVGEAASILNKLLQEYAE